MQTVLGALLEVEMSKKWAPLWREAHFEIKSGKKTGLGPLFEVEMLKSVRHCGAKMREAHLEVNGVNNSHG